MDPKRKRKHKDPRPFVLERQRLVHDLSVPMSLDIRTLRIRGRHVLNVTPQVETLNWADSDPGSDVAMSGSLTGRRTDPLDPASLPLQAGDRIAIQYRDAMNPRGKWQEEVRFQLDEPDSEPQSYGVVNLTMSDPYIALSNLEAEFVYRRDRHHKGGWRSDTIIKDACRRMGVPIGHVPQGHVIFPSPYRSHPLGDNPGTPRAPLTVFIQQVLNHEFSETKRRLRLAIVNGQLEVLEQGAGGRAYVMDLSVQNLEVTSHSNARPATVVIGHARVGKGKKSKLPSVTVKAPRAIDRYGYLVKEVHYPRARTEAELRDHAKRTLAHGLRVIRTASVSVPGLPGVRPYDAVVLAAPEEHRRGIPGYQGAFSPDEFGGVYGISYISQRTHSIQAGIWTTQLDLVERDPWLNYRERLAEHKVGYRKARHKSPSTKPSSPTSAKHPRPVAHTR